MRPFFSPNKFPPSLFWLWFLFHGGIGAALLLSLLMGGVRVNTDLFDLLPSSHGTKSVAAAERLLAARTGRGVYILIGSDDFTQAREAAIELYEGLRVSPAFESLFLFVDDELIGRFSQYLHEYRYVLLDRETRNLLETGEERRVAEDALAAAFGAFNVTSLDNLETDPFLLADRSFRSFLSSTLRLNGALSPREDVLAARQGDRWYVLIQGALSPTGASITNRSSGVEQIYALAGSLETRFPDRFTGLEVVYSGVPFHSYASSSNAQREISLISTVSLLAILVLFLWIFRSPLPIVVSLGAIGLSIGLAALSTFLFFREIHILTFVFGATLIGMCVDYSVHYFVHWKGNPRLNSGKAIRAHIIRGLTMSLLSSEICFLAMLFTPFGMLRQFAVFSLMGLLSSYLSVVCLYPKLKPAATGKGIHRIPRIPRIPPFNVRFPRIFGRVRAPWKRGAFLGITALILLTLLCNRDRIRIENNIASLYTMPEQLRESEKLAASVLNHGSSGWYFILQGDSPEALLEREEALRARLDEHIAQGDLSAYMAPSMFIPSLKTQDQNYAAAAALLPLAEAQFGYLGFPPEAAALFQDDYRDAQGKRLVPGDELPPYLGELLAQLWIGQVDGAYYSCILPLHPKGEESFRLMAAGMDGVFFVNKVRDIGEELDILSRMMLLLFAAAYLVIAVVVRIRYSWRDTARICLVPCLVVLATLAVLAAADIPLGFFSIIGLVLVFGLGLDYMFYLIEAPSSRDRPLTIFAILLSYGTTALSFGALALSGFIPVHIFGLTVFAGLSAAFIFAMLLRAGGSGENQGSGGNQGS